MNYAKKTIQELINTDFHCSCGRVHRAEIEHIEIGRGVISRLPGMIRRQKLGAAGCFDTSRNRILLVSDCNTQEAAGHTVCRLLKAEGFLVEEYCFVVSDMHAEDRYAAELQQAADGVSLLIAVGSGTINDIARYVSFHADIPYYIVATAPSMDGYASNVSPLIHNNLKTTYICKCASAIIGDTDFLATCPDRMIGAGLGDIVGKFIAIHDWEMSHLITGEYYCGEVAELVLHATKQCVDSVPALKRRDPDALAGLMTSLVLIGIAMSFIGVSRPASSSEHHIAHLLEMKSIFRGEYGHLHGINVGMATCLIHEMYKKFLTLPFDFNRAASHAQAYQPDAWQREIQKTYQSAAGEVISLSESSQQNEPEHVMERVSRIMQKEGTLRGMITQVVEDTKHLHLLLPEVDGMVSPAESGFDKQEIREILLYAKDLRSRYAALQLFYDLGVLEELADSVVEQYLPH